MNRDQIWQTIDTQRARLCDLLTDLYMIAFLIAIYGWAGIDSVSNLLHREVAASPADPAARYWIGVGAGIALSGFVWQGLTAVGPLQVGPAVQSWLASTPISRTTRSRTIPTPRRRQLQQQVERTELEPVARHDLGLADPAAVDEGPVRRAEVGDDHALAVAGEHGVAARDPFVADDEVA